MTSCPSDEILESLLNGELDETRMQELDAHLQNCAACRSRLDELTECDTSHGLRDSSVKSQTPLASVDSIVRELQKKHSEFVDTGDESPNEPQPMTIRPGMVLGEFYEIHELLGSGAMGAVFRAIDTRVQRQVAIKRLHPSLLFNSDAQERLAQEARASAALSHHGIVRLFEFAKPTGEAPFLVMEFVSGVSLDEHIESQGSLPPNEAANITADIASALEAAHGQGLVHRDVKSSNILLDADTGKPRITDFGLARLIEVDSRLTQEGSIAGTPAYMSPEQIDDASSADGRSDVYSLGIVLYEMLTATLPFRGTARMTLQQVQYNDPSPPRTLNELVPRDLQNVCMKAIAKRPQDRYASAVEFESDLRRFLAGESVLARPAGPFARTLKWFRRNPRIGLLWASVAAIFVLATAISTASAYVVWTLNQEMQEANDGAMASASQARKQRNIALDTLRKLVGEVFDEVDKIANESDSDTSRLERMLAETAVKGLKDLETAGGLDGESSHHKALGHYQLGATLWRVNELESAEVHLKQALEAAREVRKRQNRDYAAAIEIEIDALLTLAWVEQDRGNYEDATKIVRDALQIVEAQEKLPELPQLRQMLFCECYIGLGEASDYEENRGQALQAFAKAKQILDTLLKSDPDSDSVQMLQQEYERTTIVDNISELTDSKISATDLQNTLNQANAARANKQPEDEEQLLLTALEQFDVLAFKDEQTDRTSQRISALMRLGDVYRELERPRDARFHYEEAIDFVFSQEDDFSVIHIDAQILIARTFLDQGRPGRARKAIELAFEYIEDIAADVQTVDDAKLPRQFLQSRITAHAFRSTVQTENTLRDTDREMARRLIEQLEAPLNAEQQGIVDADLTDRD